MGAAAVTTASSSSIHRQRMPARNTTVTPDSAIRMAVPRSGCSITSHAGTNTTNRASSSCQACGGSGRCDSIHATIMGNAIFMTSAGWKRSCPSSSQRCAPLPVMPASSTKASSASPAPYTHGDQRCSTRGGTRAITNITSSATPMRVPCRASSAGSWPLALYTNAMLTPHSAKMPANSGKSRLRAQAVTPLTFIARR